AGHQDATVVEAPRGGQQAPFSDRSRDLVVLARVAERSRHAAAASVEIDDRCSRYPAEKRFRRGEAAHCFLMTVAVQEDLRRSGAQIEPHTRGVALALEKLFEEHRPIGNAQRSTLRLAPKQGRHVFANRREAAGLEKDDRHSTLGQRKEPGNAGGGPPPGPPPETLWE